MNTELEQNNSELLEAAFRCAENEAAECADSPEDGKPVHSVETPEKLRDCYEFLCEIGHGTQGHIYKAKDLVHHRTVAIKQLRISSVSTWKEYELFRRESDILQALKMKGVAEFYDALEFLEEEKPEAYIVQEYIEGETLADFMKSGRRMTLSRTYDLLIQCLDILENLHHHDPAVIHRDIKPSNIMLKHRNGDDFEVYLIDFGAVANPQVQGGGSTVAGTFGYMPPEQLMGRPVPQSDIYSLAATAVHLFSQISPADMAVTDFQLLFEPHMQSMPTALTYTLRAMLKPKADERFCDYEILREIFKNFKEGNYSIPKEISSEKSLSTPEDRQRLAHFDKSLSQVVHINAPGNIELWQNLPLQTPRKVPNSYKKIFQDNWHTEYNRELVHRKKSAPLSYNLKIFIKYYLKTFVYPPSAPNSTHGFSLFIFIAMIVICMIILLKLFLAVVLLLQSKNLDMVFIEYLFIAYSSLVFIYVCIEAPMDIGFRNHFKPFATNNHYIDIQNITNDSIQEAQEIFQQIILDGTKTLATITEVSYVCQRNTLFEYIKSEYDNSDQGHINSANTDRLLAYTERPLFLIKYSFNPADDHNPNDLVHEIYTRTAPEDHYKPGDPLPILYTIETRKNIEIVRSIPFPACMHDELPANMMTGKSKYLLDQAETEMES